jgi:hypothetical protein
VGGARGTSYTVVNDSFGNTEAHILSGIYGNTAEDYNGRVLTQTVDTGWTASAKSNTCSDILTLWGMTNVGSSRTDTYTLSMKYDPARVASGSTQMRLATFGSSGNLVNVVSKNTGGASTFVNGPWQPGYGLGTFGLDTTTNTVWAVINYDGEFVVATGF